MRALVHDPSAPHGLLLAEAPDPAPSPSQVLVEVHASSLNFGELTFMTERHAPGHVAGNDAAGVVAAAAVDGSGPARRDPRRLLRRGGGLGGAPGGRRRPSR